MLVCGSGKLGVLAGEKPAVRVEGCEMAKQISCFVIVKRVVCF